MFKKADSKELFLATTTMDGRSAGFAGAKNRSVSILGQPPRFSDDYTSCSFGCAKYNSRTTGSTIAMCDTPPIPASVVTIHRIITEEEKS